MSVKYSPHSILDVEEMDSGGSQAVIDEPEVHEVDPNGDVVLILCRRTVTEAKNEAASENGSDTGDADVLAEEEPPTEEPAPFDDADVLVEEEPPIEEPAPFGDTDILIEEEPPAEEQAPYDDEAPAEPAPAQEDPNIAVSGSVAGSEDVAVQAALLEQFGSTRRGDESATLSSEGELAMIEHVQEVRLRVSSKHLILASLVFKSAFCGKFSEAQTLRKEQYLEKPLPDDDPDAWIILLKILHHQNREVPRKVDLEILARIACLVDKYFLHEAIEMYADLWIADLEPQLPSSFGADSVSWMWISWVFKKQNIYTSMTKLAEHESNDRIDTNDLPISTDIIEIIQEHRQSSAGEIVSMLWETREKFLKTQTVCQYDCDAKVLGILTREFHRLGLSGLFDRRPYRELSLQSFAQKIRNTVVSRIRTNTDCQNRSNQGYYSYENTRVVCQNLNMATKVEKFLDEVLSARTGLDFNAQLTDSQTWCDDPWGTKASKKKKKRNKVRVREIDEEA